MLYHSYKKYHNILSKFVIYSVIFCFPLSSDVISIPVSYIEKNKHGVHDKHVVVHVNMENSVAFG